MSETYRLPPVMPQLLGSPTPEATEAWVQHFVNVLRSGRLSPEELRIDVECTWRDSHPLELRFYQDALDRAIERHHRGVPGWYDVDNWTREDFIRRIKQDQAEGRSGSKVSVARRAGMSPTALWRRWQAVRRPGERWPSGQKGPADWADQPADQ